VNKEPKVAFTFSFRSQLLYLMSQQNQKDAEEDACSVACGCSGSSQSSSSHHHRMCWIKQLLSSKEKAVSGRVEGR